MAIITTQDEQHEIVLTDTCADGDAIGLNSAGNWVRSDADAAAPINARFFALKGAAKSGDTIKVTERIKVRDVAAFTKGALQYLSATAGKSTQTNPIAVATLVQVIGIALSADEAIFDAQIPHLTIKADLAGAAPATAANYGTFFTSDRNWRVLGGRSTHRTAAAGTTVDVEKLTSGQAKAAGVSVLAATLSMAGTADTPVASGPSATVANPRLKPGDRLGLNNAGTLTGLADLNVTVQLVEDL